MNKVDLTLPRDRFLEVRACPACGDGDSLEAGQRAEGFSALIGGVEFPQCEYSIRECCSCGLLFRTPIPTREILSRYYERVDFRKWEVSGHFPTEKVALSVLRGLPTGACLLDFGCSTGRLFAPLVREYRCHGFEIDPRAAKEAAGKGIAMLEAECLEAHPVERFDAIVMMDVFEHLPSPTATMRQLSQSLKPGGMLVVGTGDGDAPACRLDPAQFWYFRIIEHLSMLTSRHGQWLARELGMDLVRWERMCHYNHSWRVAAAQYLRHWAYWAFRRDPGMLRSLLRHLPGIRKAEHWKVAPEFSASCDHVVAVFVKGGGAP